MGERRSAENEVKTKAFERSKRYISPLRPEDQQGEKV